MLETKSSLDGWGRMAERHWRENHPSLVRELESSGQLYPTLKALETEGEAMYDRLRKQKLDHQQATEIVQSDLILANPTETSDPPTTALQRLIASAKAGSKKSSSPT